MFRVLNLLIKFSLIFSVIISTGCAKHAMNYIPSKEEYKSDYSRVYNYPYDVVWKSTIDALAHSFWTLENIEKDSGIITLSFATDSPERYIDCGDIQNYFWAVGNTQDITFIAACGGQSLKMMDAYGRFHPIVYRDTDLIGKSNVLVKRINKNKTEVTVSTKYVFKMTLQSLGASFGFGYVPPISEKTFINLTTDEPGSASSTRVTCKSKNFLESKILDLISKKLP